MEEKFKRPKGFGEILDLTFSLSKYRFKDLFMILLILMGPVYVLQAIIQLATGTSFFRNAGSGGAWYEQMLSNLEGTETINSGSFGTDLGLIVAGLLGFILFPVAEAAILFAINHIRQNEEFTVGLVIKQAFSRFWPVLGSTILFGLITFGIVIVPIVMISLVGVFGSFTHPALGIGLAIILFIAFSIGIGLLLTKWSFYFGSVVLDRKSPGFSESWQLTKKRTWASMGLYMVFYLIISSISFSIELSFSAVLGNSVLLTMIVNTATLFTTLFFSVGYGVMYLDLKTRNNADELKEMIADYDEVTK